MFWQLMVDLSRQDKVTIFISTHFMNEAERCDRMSLMHAGKVLASGTPQELVQQRGAANLEAAFISRLQEAAGAAPETTIPPSQTPAASASGKPSRQGLSFRRLFSYSRREALELRRDPVRSTLALLGTVILMLIMGYGISMDVENLRFAVLDRDQTVSSGRGRSIWQGPATLSNSRRSPAMTSLIGGCVRESWRLPLRSRLILAAILLAVRQRRLASGWMAPCPAAPRR